jgi:hypothetical protein
MAKKSNKEPATDKDAQTPQMSETSEDQLAMLLRDLQELSGYLTERGRHTYELAQRFMEHARQDRDPSTRAYDERQATMLGYQRHVWVEIAGLVNKLLVQYGDDRGESSEAGAKDEPHSPDEQVRRDGMDRQE